MLMILLPDLYPHSWQWEADPGASAGYWDCWPWQPQQQREQPGGFSQQRLPKLGVPQDAVWAPQLLWYHPWLSSWPAPHTTPRRFWWRWQPHLHEHPGLPVPTPSSIHWGRRLNEVVPFWQLWILSYQENTLANRLLNKAILSFRLKRSITETLACFRSAEAHQFWNCGPALRDHTT